MPLLRSGGSVLCLVVGAMLMAAACRDSRGPTTGAAGQQPTEADAAVVSPIVLSVSAIDFGTQVVGKTSEKRIAVRNQGSRELDELAVKVPRESGFAAELSSCPPLPPDSACPIVLKFAPLSAGPRSGILTVGAGADQLRLELRGTGENATPDSNPPGLQAPLWLVYFAVLISLGIIGLLCFTLFEVFAVRAALEHLRGSLRDLKTRVPEPVAGFQRVFDLLSRVAADIEKIKAPRSQPRRDDQTRGVSGYESKESRSMLEGIPDSWLQQERSVDLPSERRTGAARSPELPFDRYCQGDMTLEQLTEWASRQRVRWGSFVARAGRYEFADGNCVNKLIGFQRPGRSNEFDLVLGEGTIWNVDFLQFFEMWDNARPGDNIFTEKPAHVQLRDGLLEPLSKGAMKRA